MSSTKTAYSPKDKKASMTRSLNVLWSAYGEPLEKTSAEGYFYNLRKPWLDQEALGEHFCKVASDLRQDPWDLAWSVVDHLPAYIQLAKTASNSKSRRLAQYYVNWTEETEKRAFVGALVGGAARGLGALGKGIAGLAGRASNAVGRGLSTTGKGMASVGKRLSATGATAKAAPTAVKSVKSAPAVAKRTPKVPKATTGAPPTSTAPASKIVENPEALPAASGSSNFEVVPNAPTPVKRQGLLRKAKPQIENPEVLPAKSKVRGGGGKGKDPDGPPTLGHQLLGGAALSVPAYAGMQLMGGSGEEAPQPQYGYPQGY